MKETCGQARDFLNAVFNGVGFELVAKVDDSEDCVLDLGGEDALLLRNEGGELLEAFEQLVNKAFSKQLSSGQRIICDVENFRATREAELRAMAHYAADRVRSTRSAFTFNPMNPNERRIIHLALADDSDLATESVGDGNLRRLRVFLKSIDEPQV